MIFIKVTGCKFCQCSARFVEAPDLYCHQRHQNKHLAPSFCFNMKKTSIKENLIISAS